MPHWLAYGMWIVGSPLTSLCGLTRTPSEQVKLCDIVSGGFTHTLSGHRAAVWAAHWSPSNEWQLVTGGCDGQLRLWDIRRSGPLHIFDQHDTQEQRAQQQQRVQQQQQQSEAQDGGLQNDGLLQAPRRQLRQDTHQQQQQQEQQTAATLAHGSMQRQGSGGSTSRRRQRQGGKGAGAGAGGSAACAPGSARMFLPERVTQYSTAHAGSVTGGLANMQTSNACLPA